VAEIDKLPRHNGNLWEQPGLSGLVPKPELRPLLVRLNSVLRSELRLVGGLDVSVPTVDTTLISDALYVQAGHFNLLTAEFGSQGATAAALVDRGYDGFVVVYLARFVTPTGVYSPSGEKIASRRAVREDVAYEFEAWKAYRQQKPDLRFRGVAQPDLSPPGAPRNVTDSRRQPDPGPGVSQVPPRRKGWLRRSS
jgi:hypothetical protein